MATVTRSNSRMNPPLYKDYVNFLASYKTGKKDELNSAGQMKNFSVPNANSTSSTASPDVTDFSKSSSTPSYNAYLETTTNKKFGTVKPNFEEKVEVKQQPTTKKSEIVIEIQSTKSVSEVSKMFEQKDLKTPPPPKNNKLNSKISIFEKQILLEQKPKIANKPAFCKSPSPKIDAFCGTVPPPLKSEPTQCEESNNLPPPPSMPPTEVKLVPPPPSMPPTEVKLVPPPPPMPSADSVPLKSAPITKNENILPPPPPFVNGTQPIKIQATLNKGPQTKYTVSSQNGIPSEIDRNDPMVKKLVYGTLRGMYGAYHDKATDMLATLPKNMVVRSNGVQQRIEQIAASGDLDKLNGRVNPKIEQE